VIVESELLIDQVVEHANEGFMQRPTPVSGDGGGGREGTYVRGRPP